MSHVLHFQMRDRTGNVVENAEFPLKFLNENHICEIFFSDETLFGDFKFSDRKGKMFERDDGVKFEIMMFDIAKFLFDTGAYTAIDPETGHCVVFKIVKK